MKKLVVSFAIFASTYVSAHAKNFCTLSEFSMGSRQIVSIECMNRIEGLQEVLRDSDSESDYERSGKFDLRYKAKVVNFLLEKSFKPIGCGSYEQP